MYTRKYCVSFVQCGPHAVSKSCLWVMTRPGFRMSVAKSLYSIGVR